MSMKAAVVSERGGPEGMKITKIAIPTPSDTQVLVKVHAYGPNPIDVLIRAGHFPPPPFVTGGGSVPYTDGMDGAGTVESVGSKVKHLKKGERVFWLFSATGTCAEYALVDAKFVFNLSPKLSYTQGAAMGIPLLTALRVIDIKANAKKGQTMLIHGASGAVGLLAVQIAKLRGLNVIGSAGTAEGIELVRKCGADHVVNHRDADSADKILAITKGAGVDVIFELVASVNAVKDQKILKKGGTLLVVGTKEYGGMGYLDIGALIGLEFVIIGQAIFSVTDEELKTMRRDIDLMQKNNEVKPIVANVYCMEDVAQAHFDSLAGAGSRGKLVVSIIPEAKDSVKF